MKQPNERRIAALVKELLVELGEDPGRDGLRKTPERVAKSLAFLTRGYRQNLRAVVNGAKHEIYRSPDSVLFPWWREILAFYAG